MFDRQIDSRESGELENSCLTLPPSFRRAHRPFQMDRRRLLGPVPLHFEQFYRAHLRFVVGERVGSTNVARFYAAWADANAAPSIGSRAIKRAMLNIGHSSMNSNGVKYCDVALAADFPELPDNYPAIPLPSEAYADQLAKRLDAMITELSSIRAQVTAAGTQSNQH
jgi:hypothetical protein